MHDGRVLVTFLSIDECPNADLGRRRLAEALETLDLDPTIVTFTTVHTTEEAERLRFRGSPSILIDGVDPFADQAAPVGLSCRIYRTEHGFEGAPSVAALAEVLQA